MERRKWNKRCGARKVGNHVDGVLYEQVCQLARARNVTVRTILEEALKTYLAKGLGGAEHVQ